MEVKAKQLDSVNATASVKIPSAAIKNEVENLAKKASKTIKMDGFRPGKVPVSAVLKRYEKELISDAEQNLFKNAVDNALKELKKEIKELVGEPYFEKFDRENGEIIAELILSFKPELKLEGYEKCIPEFSTPKVSKKEIDEKKNELLKRYATTEAIKTKRALKEGDYAKFDFEGFVDGKAFDGGKAENYVLEIGSKQFIPGFEEAMVGMKSGEEKDISVTFPKEYGAPNLAGKDAIFKIKLHEIQELKIPELNEELLKKLLPNEEKASEELLEEKLKEQIKNEKLFKLINEELKAKFADALIETFDFDLPKGVLEQEIDMQFRRAFAGFGEEEKKEIQSDKDKYQAKRDSFKDEAKKSVKLTFIVDELAKLRKIEVSDQELVQAVYFEAYRYGFNPKEHLDNYKKQGALPAVKMALIEDKLFNDIFMPKEKAKKEKKEDK
ncbi:trigger factor [Campylobacter helveticus]|uniref:Trigger factor n=2 Tax=Campylobacter helveticus TaxID=28898 RepID=A0AAX2UM55_9BACT|nr:trigger factor [Campylobacter helveticus]ARE79953.1 trigger factor (peptidyl-prolyl cis /trans isomerase, chaperone) [Campylobacter helveticus]MCR2040299.1 trigger factor [Campylobacter helveticus]MCR2054211.1 trigger factor [Campylobacter helveticus]MCR2057261.1 trigger factor [Campylobacter helveticus]MCR2063008.1 trigger factor [Campylobacter helveticus]